MDLQSLTKMSRKIVELVFRFIIMSEQTLTTTTIIIAQVPTTTIITITRIIV
jgi:hypothetical protein